jgi:hypothetical protein
MIKTVDLVWTLIIVRTCLGLSLHAIALHYEVQKIRMCVRMGGGP